jgi:hypothetical protein
MSVTTTIISEITIISENKIEFDGKMYKMLKPKKKYHCKLDPEKKKDRAVYMRSWRKQKKDEITALYDRESARLAEQASGGSSHVADQAIAEPIGAGTQ